jgi:asparagine synthase (glutamine-hydrolysing)
MCGIVGFFSKNGVDADIIRAMNNEIRHRGPDNDGFYFEPSIGLGMRRLKVIDLESGDQPKTNEDGTIIVIFNGEIYNYLPLREELSDKGHIFTTKSDTEVLIHGFEEWGIQGLLTRINGMFAFCIYDKKNMKAFFARDRLGEKPFYYFHDDQEFIFSSELRGLLRSGKIPFSISKSSLFLYLAVHYVPGDQCIISGVKKLLPGYFAELDLRSYKCFFRPYWILDKNRDQPSDYSEALKQVRQLVEESVRMRMISDVPLGLFLSGGIDSSILAGLMVKNSKKLETFSVGFKDKGYDETEYSQLVSQHFGTNHHHFIFDEHKVREFLPKIIASMDEPCGDQALLPVYWLSHEARKFVTVVLGGEGGDEVFGGYSYYPSEEKKEFSSRITGIIQFLNTNFSKKNTNNLENQYSNSLFPLFLSEKCNTTSSNFPIISDLHLRVQLIKDFSFEEITDEMNRYSWYEAFSRERKKINQTLEGCQYTDLKTWLPDDLLMKFDKMCMAHSLEGRAPYLDYRIVELGITLFPDWKIHKGIHKKILRDAFRDLLPEKVLNRPKQGFIMPMSDWLKTDFRDILDSLPSDCINDGLNNSVLQRVISEHVTGQAERGRLIYSLMIYRLWCSYVLETYYMDRQLEPLNS